MLPPRLQHYEIIGLIGKGGMSLVYKARQKSLQRVVAIKELKEGLSSDNITVKRFEREAIAASSLSHENIVSIYEYFLHETHRYLVMEYVGGVDLTSVWLRTRKLPVLVASMIVLQVVRALEYAHAMGLVHRDIKPGNIMITPGGLIKLMDFGVVLAPDKESLTLPGTFVGTPRYMSPEQIMGHTVNFRSDLFSVGILFYELLTGIKLFEAADNTHIFAKITKMPVQNPKRLRSGIPRPIARIIMRCLRRNPSNRFATTQQLRRALEAFIGDQHLVSMRRELAHFLVAQRLITDEAMDPHVTRAEKVLPSPWRESLARAWVGPEYWGLGWGLVQVIIASAALVWLIR